MSLVCLECNCIGAFNTLVIFDSNGKFDPQKLVSDYSNFYTDCATFDDFSEVNESRFMIVEERKSQNSWNIATDGDKLHETRCKLIDENVLAVKLPRIFKELIERSRL